MKNSALRNVVLGTFSFAAAIFSAPAFAADQIPGQTIQYRIEAFQIPVDTSPDISSPAAVHDAYDKKQLLSVSVVRDPAQPSSVVIKSKVGEQQPFLDGVKSPYIKSASKTYEEGDNIETEVEATTALDGWSGTVSTDNISGSTVSFTFSAEFAALKKLVTLATWTEPGIPDVAIMAPLYRAGSKAKINQEIKVPIAKPTVVRVDKSHVLIVTATLT